MSTLQKWHGAGNDFLVSLGEHRSAEWNADAARAVCHRHLGIGADGLLVGDTADGRLTMTLYNADGSIAEMSGNGIRCLVAAYCRSTGETNGVIGVDTLAGHRQVRITLEGAYGTGSVAMGPVTLLPALKSTLGVASVGNPHVVVLDNEEWSDDDRERLASKWSNDHGGANVEFVRLISLDHVAMRVIERGVGWTLACGTGSCAVAAVCNAAGLTAGAVRVANPGGTLLVHFDEQGAVLEGPVAYVGDVEWQSA